ncbi:MAG: hypothetical protein ORN51_07625 [Akkermansiaceae bacterium]|nr:hypothetical protein [Akkermansiaceae bacterium]
MVNRLSRVFVVFGLNLWVFLGLQMISSVFLGKLIAPHLHLPLLGIAVGHLGFCLIADFSVYLIYKGRRSVEFVPGAFVAGLLTIAPAVILFIAARIGKIIGVI